MTIYTDLSLITDAAYRFADLIDGGHYSNIFYYEFHEPVDPKANFNSEEGVISFSERLQENLERVDENLRNIFFTQYYVDDFPAIIHIAIKIADDWFIARDCGSNYYLGSGPTGILRLREACAKKRIAVIVSEDKFEEWLKKKFVKTEKTVSQKKKDKDGIEFKRICNAIEHLTSEMQRRRDQFQGLTEENIRDGMLVTLNPLFKSRGHAESKNGKGKTDILIRTKDGLNEYIFELKVWDGIETLEEAIEQLQGYLSWHNKYCGIIMFCYQVDFTKTLNKVEKYLQDNYNLALREEYKESEFRFRLNHLTDEYKTIETHLTFINLKTIPNPKKKTNGSR